MDTYSHVLNHVSSLQMSQAELSRLSRRQSSRSAARPQVPSTRSSRVEKPSSRQTSPNGPLRRRPTVSSHLRYPQSQELSQRSNIMSRGGSGAPRLERPLSWHPTSTEVFELPAAFQQQPMTWQNTPSGIGRSSYEWPDETSTDTRLPQAIPAAYFERSPAYHPAVAVNQYQSQMTLPQPNWSSHSSMGTTHSATHAGLVQHQQYPSHQRQATNTGMPTFNSNHWHQSEAPGLDEDVSPGASGSADEEELVGLGLYDRTVSSGSGLLGLTKSLKLTEEWCPPNDRHSIASSQSSQATDNSPYNTYQAQIPAQSQPKVELPYQAQDPYPFNFSDHGLLLDPELSTGWYDEQYSVPTGHSNRISHY